MLNIVYWTGQGLYMRKKEDTPDGKAWVWRQVRYGPTAHVMFASSKLSWNNYVDVQFIEVKEEQK